MYRTSLFIFRRDLRIDDNTGLIAACSHSQKVIPCFIFDPRQVGDDNAYRSARCVQFMIQSLEDVNKQLERHKGQLLLFEGVAEDVVTSILTTRTIDAIYINRDYTPFSQQRDAALEKLCKKNGIAFHAYDDALLNPPEAVRKKDGSPYVKFTPFYHAALQIPIQKPQKNTHQNYFTGHVPGSYTQAQVQQVFSLSHNTRSILPGGRTECLKILKDMASYNNYKTCRDIPEYDCTTHLSAHLKFTTCSPRELYHAMKEGLNNAEPLIRQLHWRDFFTHVAYSFPHVFSGSFNTTYHNLAWKNDPLDFERWCQGMTGFPIVDAGMRQLRETGWMHNRARLIVASFLTKDLHIDWREGERFFAQSLIDYDPSVNNGNWQWVAGTGCDAQPYFRIFNPWLQQKKFDPHCAYIKTWVPELKNYSNDTIHNWFKPNKRPHTHAYPAPMVDHTQAAQETLRMFRSYRASH